MNRELKLALIVGFSLVLLVTVLVSDHLSKARKADLAGVEAARPLAAVDPTSQPAMLADPPMARTPGLDAGEAPMSAPAAPIAHDPAPTQPPDAAITALPLVKFDQSGGRSADPDAGLVQTVRDLGGQVVDRNGVREVVLPQAPLVATTGSEVRHVVASGESLFAIAKKYYGDGAAWKRIRDANPDRVSESGVVRAGVTLRIPGVAPTVTRGTPSGPTPDAGQSGSRPAEPRAVPRRTGAEAVAGRGPATPGRPATYTVRRGDTLGEIAQRMLGSARRKHELMRLNNISDENTILAGAVLRLPER